MMKKHKRYFNHSCEAPPPQRTNCPQMVRKKVAEQATGC